VGQLVCGRRPSLSGVELERQESFAADSFGFVAIEEVLVFLAERVHPFRMLHVDPPFVGVYTMEACVFAVSSSPFCASRQFALVVFGQKTVTLGVSICLEWARIFSAKNCDDSPRVHGWPGCVGRGGTK